MSVDGIHVVPLNDLREHILSAHCECEPNVEVAGAVLIYTHNSWDHREFFEDLELWLDSIEEKRK